ncbi:uncharacterized protein iqcm isoform X1 [Lepisosteus oculatus]|uniref:uncharacterized protein iqcm isoform X1 n=1 Tax=Lepisosteus oculatus TaxID=7918 RepID=UPI0035F519D7
MAAMEEKVKTLKQSYLVNNPEYKRLLSEVDTFCFNQKLSSFLVKKHRSKRRQEDHASHFYSILLEMLYEVHRNGPELQLIILDKVLGWYQTNNPGIQKVLDFCGPVSAEHIRISNNASPKLIKSAPTLRRKTRNHVSDGHSFMSKISMEELYNSSETHSVQLQQRSEMSMAVCERSDTSHTPQSLLSLPSQPEGSVHVNDILLMVKNVSLKMEKGRSQTSNLYKRPVQLAENKLHPDDDNLPTICLGGKSYCDWRGLMSQSSLRAPPAEKTSIPAESLKFLRKGTEKESSFQEKRVTSVFYEVTPPTKEISKHKVKKPLRTPESGRLMSTPGRVSLEASLVTLKRETSPQLFNGSKMGEKNNVLDFSCNSQSNINELEVEAASESNMDNSEELAKLLGMGAHGCEKMKNGRAVLQASQGVSIETENQIVSLPHESKSLTEESCEKNSNFMNDRPKRPSLSSGDFKSLSQEIKYFDNMSNTVPMDKVISTETYTEKKPWQKVIEQQVQFPSFMSSSVIGSDCCIEAKDAIPTDEKILCDNQHPEMTGQVWENITAEETRNHKDNLCHIEDDWRKDNSKNAKSSTEELLQDVSQISTIKTCIPEFCKGNSVIRKTNTRAIKQSTKRSIMTGKSVATYLQTKNQDTQLKVIMLNENTVSSVNSKCIFEESGTPGAEKITISENRDLPLEKKEQTFTLQRSLKAHRWQLSSIYNRRQNGELREWMDIVKEEKMLDNTRRQEQRKKSQQMLQHFRQITKERLKRVGPHLEVYDAFHPKRTGPSSRDFKRAAICIQKHIRGWLTRAQLNRIRAKALSHGPSLTVVVKEYYQMMRKLKRRFGIKKLSVPLVYMELEQWLDRKTMYEQMFAKREFWKEMDKNELPNFFRDCGHFPSAQDIENTWSLINHGTFGKAGDAVKKQQAVEMAFTLYPPPSIKHVNARQSTWVYPIVDGEEGCRYLVSDHPVLKEADIQVVGRLVCASMKERKDRQELTNKPNNATCAKKAT